MMLLTVCIISTQLMAQKTKTSEKVPVPSLPPAKEMIEVPVIPPLPTELTNAPEQVINSLPELEKDKPVPPPPPPPQAPPAPPVPPVPPVKG